jgi:hypothetical protein
MFARRVERRVDEHSPPGKVDQRGRPAQHAKAQLVPALRDIGHGRKVLQNSPALPVETTVGTRYGFGDLLSEWCSDDRFEFRRRIEWLWLSRRRMMVKLR